MAFELLYFSRHREFRQVDIFKGAVFFATELTLACIHLSWILKFGRRYISRETLSGDDGKSGT